MHISEEKYVQPKPGVQIATSGKCGHISTIAPSVHPVIVYKCALIFL